MQIDGLDKKPEPIVEELGVFKLKDRPGRNAIQIDLRKLKKPLTEAEFIYFFKIQGESNKIRVSIQWKSDLKDKK